jgi:hypothetical protein
MFIQIKFILTIRQYFEFDNQQLVIIEQLLLYNNAALINRNVFHLMKKLQFSTNMISMV